MKKILMMMPFLLAFLSCSKKVNEKTTTVSPKSTTYTTVPKPTPEPPTASANMVTSNDSKNKIPEGVDSSIVASLKRTPCYGKCPYYKVDIYETGRVVYEGMAHVAKMGRYEANISPEMLQKIRQRATDINYLKLSDKYPLNNIDIADVPSTITYVRVGNEGKRIFNNFDAPKGLIEFERWLEKEIEGLKFLPLKD